MVDRNTIPQPSFLNRYDVTLKTASEQYFKRTILFLNCRIYIHKLKIVFEIVNNYSTTSAAGCTSKISISNVKSLPANG